MNKLVIYTASFCNPCQRLKEIVEQFRDELEQSCTVEIKDIETHFEDALKHNVRAAPTTLLLNEEDKLLNMAVGITDIIELRKFLQC